MKTVEKNILGKLKKPESGSHKGQNGRILVIAGSKKFHGALLLTIEAASRIVDMVYVHSTDRNLELVEKIKNRISAFIGVSKGELWETIEMVDTIVVGPGLEESKVNKRLVEKILKKYPEKNMVVDATALWHVDPLLLHPNCVVTPHSREFENTFKCDPTSENVQKMAKYYQCVIVLTGAVDYISDGKELWENKTGNVGMTKGGTGDVLVGVVGSFLSTGNDPLLSAQAGAYVNGWAGDRLKEKVGGFFNAQDVVSEMGELFKDI